MAHYDAVQRISDAMIWVKKLCRDMSPRFAEVQNALDNLGDDKELQDTAEKKNKPCLTHVALAKYRARVAEANLHVETANEIMAEVHDNLSQEAIRTGCDDHVYQRNGPGGR